MASGGSAGAPLKDYRWVKVDIHGCLNAAMHQPDLGQWNPGAFEFMKSILAEPGWGLKLSCGGFRDGGDDFKAKVDRALLRHGIDRKSERVLYVPDDRYILAVNDRGVDYQDNWPDIEKLALKMIAEAERRNTPDIPNDLYGRK